MTDAPYESPAIERGLDGVPTLADMPDPKVFTQADAWSVEEISHFIDRFRLAGADWANFVNSQEAYLQRMSTMTPDSPGWDREMDTLVGEQSSRALTGYARRVHQNTTTLMATDGDPNAVLVWLDEGDDSVCEVCEDLSGEEATFAERISTPGMMPGERCLGGNSCRCELVRVRG